MTALTVYKLNQHPYGRYLTLRDWDQLHDRYANTATPPFAGEPMMAYWKPVDLVDDEECRTTARDTGLLFSYHSFIVLSEATYQSASVLLEPFGEFLPAVYQSRSVHLFHCTNIRSRAIDRNGSIRELGHICGPTIDYRKLCFDTDVVDSPMMFRTGDTSFNIWFSTVGDDISLLKLFLDHQTGFLPQPVFVTHI